MNKVDIFHTKDFHPSENVAEIGQHKQTPMHVFRGNFVSCGRRAGELLRHITIDIWQLPYVLLLQVHYI